MMTQCYNMADLVWKTELMMCGHTHGSLDFRLGSGAGGSSQRTLLSKASSKPNRQSRGRYVLWFLAAMMTSNAAATDVTIITRSNTVIAEMTPTPMRKRGSANLNSRTTHKTIRSAETQEPNTDIQQSVTFAQRRLIIFTSAIWSMLLCGMVIGMLRGPNVEEPQCKDQRGMRTVVECYTTPFGTVSTGCSTAARPTGDCARVRLTHSNSRDDLWSSN